VSSHFSLSFGSHVVHRFYNPHTWNIASHPDQRVYLYNKLFSRRIDYSIIVVRLHDICWSAAVTVDILTLPLYRDSRVMVSSAIKIKQIRAAVAMW